MQRIEATTRTLIAVHPLVTERVAIEMGEDGTPRAVDASNLPALTRRCLHFRTRAARGPGMPLNEGTLRVYDGFLIRPTCRGMALCVPVARSVRAAAGQLAPDPLDNLNASESGADKLHLGRSFPPGTPSPRDRWRASGPSSEDRAGPAGAVRPRSGPYGEGGLVA